MTDPAVRAELAAWAAEAAAAWAADPRRAPVLPSKLRGEVTRLRLLAEVDVERPHGPVAEADILIDGKDSQCQIRVSRQGPPWEGFG